MVAEVALTLVMLVGAGLLLRSFHRLQQVNAGFSTERVLSFRLDLPEKKYEKEEAADQFLPTIAGAAPRVAGRAGGKRHLTSAAG